MEKIDRTGEINYNKCGLRMTIIKYDSNRKIVVKFEDGYIMTSNYANFKKGTLKSPYEKRLHGVGYLGEGAYITEKDGVNTKEYIQWNHIITRAYGKRYKNINPTYINCTVCEEWHNFQNFAKWYDENYYEFNDEIMELDKDILIKGNKTYSPETCVFVPHFINSLFVKRDNGRGEYPIGVTYKKSNKKYCSQISFGILSKRNVHLGYFKTPEEAFYTYKRAKEQYIKEIANIYRDKITQKLYDAMIRYEVEITD